MLSLYNSLGLDGGSVSKGNRLLAVGNDVRGSFPQYDRTTLRIDIDEDDPDEEDFGGQSRADIDQDGIVGPADLTQVLSNWNLTVDQSSNPRADVNEDGVIGSSDLTFVLSNWGIEFDIPDEEEEEEEENEEEEEEENEEEDNGEDDGGGDPPLVGIVQTINGLVYPTSRVNVKTSPALPMWIKERNV
jgi:hypothetical protein